MAQEMTTKNPNQAIKYGVMRSKVTCDRAMETSNVAESEFFVFFVFLFSRNFFLYSRNCIPFTLSIYPYIRNHNSLLNPKRLIKICNGLEMFSNCIYRMQLSYRFKYWFRCSWNYRSTDSPCPSCPFVPLPHENTFCLSVTASVCLHPHEIWTTFCQVPQGTCTNILDN